MIRYIGFTTASLDLRLARNIPKNVICYYPPLFATTLSLDCFLIHSVIRESGECGIESVTDRKEHYDKNVPIKGRRAIYQHIPTNVLIDALDYIREPRSDIVPIMDTEESMFLSMLLTIPDRDTVDTSSTFQSAIDALEESHLRFPPAVHSLRECIPDLMDQFFINLQTTVAQSIHVPSRLYRIERDIPTNIPIDR